MANWEYPDRVIAGLVNAIEDEFPEIKNSAILRNPNIQTRLLNVLEALDLRYARIKCMVIDKMYLAAAVDKVYGDIGPVGNRTPLGSFLDDLSRTYDKAFLDNFDEDGELIP